MSVIQNGGGGGGGGGITPTPTPAPQTIDQSLPVIASVTSTDIWAGFCGASDGSCDLPGQAPDAICSLACNFEFTALNQCVLFSIDGNSECLLNNIVAQPGKPLNHPGAVCSGSPEGVMDSIPKNGGGTTNVTDINSVWNGNTEVGCLYLGSDGRIYAQVNYATQMGVSFGVSIGFASVGGSSPGGYSGVNLWDGAVPHGYQFRACFSQGRILT